MATVNARILNGDFPDEDGNPILTRVSIYSKGLVILCNPLEERDLFGKLCVGSITQLSMIVNNPKQAIELTKPYCTVQQPVQLFLFSMWATRARNSFSSRSRCLSSSMDEVVLLDAGSLRKKLYFPARMTHVNTVQAHYIRTIQELFTPDREDDIFYQLAFITTQSNISVQ
eukprot:gb/GECG01016419.1/.p1 GENE.gb/GECG01016419.1/~~gb/GECG01016419.1/.p1  ORF type:complete len:171 (+),score=5.75 gb/GECG01016419.1/:1-513(+)